MRDVFISKHDGSSLKWTETIANELESRGISVWYSPRDVMSDYPKDIVRAINNCRIFLFLFDDYSNLSEHCKNEISIAFDRYSKHEPIILLSFRTTNEDPSEDIQYFLTRIHVVDGRIPPETLRIHELCDRIEYLLNNANNQVLKKISTGEEKTNSFKTNSIPISNKTEYILRGDSIYPDKKFIGRDDELRTIHEYLQGPINKLILVGMGGIGKSETAKKYALEYEEFYDKEVWIHYHKSLISSIIDDTNVEIDGINRQDYPESSDKEYFLKKMKILKRIADKKTLLIVDNFDTPDDPILEDFIEGEYTVLFTSRIHDQSTSVPELELNTLKSGNEQLDLILLEYKRKLSQKDEDAIQKIIESVQGHTLIVRLIGSVMQKNRLSPSEMLNKINNNEDWMNYESNSKKSIRNVMTDLVRMADLNLNETYILLNLSLVPESGIDVREFVKSCGIEGYDDVDTLIRACWVIHEPTEDLIHLHPLMKDIFHDQLVKNIDVAKKFIFYMINKCKYTTNLTWGKKVELFKIIESISKTIDLLDKKETIENNDLLFQVNFALSAVYMDMADYETAAEILQNLINITKKPETRARLWHKTAHALALNGEMNKAEIIAEKGIEELDSYPDNEIDQSVKAYYLRGLLERLSETLRNDGAYDKSVMCAKEAIELQKHIKRNKHHSYGWSLYHLASSYLARNSKNDLLLSEQTIMLAEKQFQIDNDEGSILYCQEILGRVRVKQKKYNEALELFNLVLKGLKDRFGENHTDVGKLYKDLGICYRKINDQSKADYYLSKAEKCYKSHHII